MATKEELKSSVSSLIKDNTTRDITGDGLQEKLFEIIDWTDAQDIAQTLQEVYNASTSPQILTDVINSSLDIRGGTGDDADNIMRWINNLGAEIMAIDGNGQLDAESIRGVNDVETLLGDIVINGTNLSNNGGVLEWNGSPVGVGSLDELSDAITNASNLFLGDTTGSSLTTGTNNTGAGQLALEDLVDGIWNTAFGYSAGKNITSGQNNTLIGTNSGNTMTSAQNNVAVGVNTLGQLTGTTSNTAIGNFALSSSTSGTGNTSTGYNSLTVLTTGIYNTAIGYNAGTYITGGVTSNLTPDRCIYIGTDTKAFADNLDNEIVIGYNTTGSGSNTVSLGNTSITDTFLGGNVHVPGSINVVGAAPFIGKSATFGTVFQGNYTETFSVGDIDFIIDSDNDSANATFSIYNHNTAGTSLFSVSETGVITTGALTGASGSFTAQSGETVTVANGLIVSIV